MLGPLRIVNLTGIEKLPNSLSQVGIFCESRFTHFCLLLLLLLFVCAEHGSDRADGGASVWQAGLPGHGYWSE